ncbi:MAG: TatD family hydrolase [Nitrospirota bacterium]|nr:TatD family hydrolase [Nitrospirota bacterium]
MSKTKTAPTLPGIIDTHAHLGMTPLADDIAAVLERARAHGVERIITIGTTRVDSERALEIAARYDNVFATVGVHPHDAVEHSENDLTEMRDLCADANCVAVGEIGLDYHYDHSPREVQRYWLRRQMELAREFSLPVVIHTREAEEDTAEILNEFPDVIGVMHCYSSGMELAKTALALGYYLSFSGIVTFNKADEVRAVAAIAPLDRILVETDCPYLAPVPFRGQTNEPAYVTLVAQKLAEIKEVTPEQMVAATTENTNRLFGLG